MSSISNKNDDISESFNTSSFYINGNKVSYEKKMYKNNSTGFIQKSEFRNLGDGRSLSYTYINNINNKYGNDNKYVEKYISFKGVNSKQEFDIMWDKIYKNNCKTEPVVCKIEPVICKTEPVVCKIEPVICKTEPVVCKTEPVVCKTEPVVCKIEPVIIPNSKFEPVIIPNSKFELGECVHITFTKLADYPIENSNRCYFHIESKRYDLSKKIWVYKLYNNNFDECDLYIPEKNLDTNSINSIKFVVSDKDVNKKVNPNFIIGDLVVSKISGEVGKVKGIFYENSMWNYIIRFMETMKNNIKHVLIDTMNESDIKAYNLNKKLR